MKGENRMQNKNQKFANVVFEQVQKMVLLQQEGEEEQGDRIAKKYKSLCKRAGSLVRNSGLVQALAFFQARGSRPSEGQYKDLYNHLQEELRSLDILSREVALFDHVRNASLPDYMYISREVLRLLIWHRRLSETLIEGTVNDDDGEES
jgi:CRISPR type III-B/RAMP module-associated protein Cmr5